VDEDPDIEISEAEVEAEVSGAVTSPGTAVTDIAGTETPETETDILIAARALIIAEVRRASTLPSTSLITAFRSLRDLTNPHIL